MKQEREWGCGGRGRGEGGRRWCRDADMESQREKKKDRQRQLFTPQPTISSLPPLLVPSTDCAALGLGLRSSEAAHGEDWRNGDALGNQLNQGLPLFLCSGCLSVGHPEWYFRVQRKRVCFSHLIHLFPKASQSLALEHSTNSTCTATPSPPTHVCRFSIRTPAGMGNPYNYGRGWVSLALFYILNLILEIGTPRVGKIKWSAQAHTESCGREATSTTLSP